MGDPCGHGPVSVAGRRFQASGWYREQSALASKAVASFNRPCGRSWPRWRAARRVLPHVIEPPEKQHSAYERQANSATNQPSPKDALNEPLVGGQRQQQDAANGG